ncbi:MAG: hypothetical protein PHT88_04045 [Candidatus Moranbacteria bacterium]|nr:hypothetical protein [Candidatus Moranbacteria bacterium]
MFEKKNGYNKIRVADIAESAFSVWLRRYKAVFFILFFGICAWSAFLWYYSLYYFHWDEQQKQEYRAAQSHLTTLDKKGFDKVLDVAENRRETYTSEPAVVRNIFMTKPKSE